MRNDWRYNSFESITGVAEAKIIQRYAEERLEPDEKNGRLSMTAIKNDFTKWAIEKGFEEYIDLSNVFSPSSNNAVLAAEPSYVKGMAEGRWQFIHGCRFKSVTDADGSAEESAKADSRSTAKLKKTAKQAK